MQASLPCMAILLQPRDLDKENRLIPCNSLYVPLPRLLRHPAGLAVAGLEELGIS